MPVRRRFPTRIPWVMALCCAVCSASVMAQAGAQKDNGKQPVKRSLYNERVSLEFYNASLETVFKQLFDPTPFNYLYAFDETQGSQSAHFTGMPMKFALDTLAKGNIYKWDVVDNVLVAAQERASTDLPDHRKYSGHVRLTPLNDVLNALNSVHLIRYRIEGDANVQVAEAKFARLEFDDALAAILKQCETPMKSMLVGKTLMISPDKSLDPPKMDGVEPAPIIVGIPLPRAAPPPPPADGIKRYNFTINGPLEDALNILFRIGRRSYRIAPRVTDTAAVVVLDKKGLAFDDLLAALLAAVPAQKTPLSFRLEKDVYVIEPKNSGAKSGEIVFPSVPGEKAVRSEYVLENRPIGEALRLILDQTGENYILGVPDSGKTVTLHLKNAAVSEALQAALRAAETPRNLEVIQDRGVYGLAPKKPGSPLSDAELKSWKFSARLHNIPAWDAFNIAGDPLGNYTLDESLQKKKVMLTTNVQDRTFDQMLSDLAHGASSEISIEYKEHKLNARAL